MSGFSDPEREPDCANCPHRLTAFVKRTELPLFDRLKAGTRQQRIASLDGGALDRSGGIDGDFDIDIACQMDLPGNSGILGFDFTAGGRAQFLFRDLNDLALPVCGEGRRTCHRANGEKHAANALHGAFFHARFPGRSSL
jgi:hypothetical protein